jgi:hypothetical protein
MNRVIRVAALSLALGLAACGNDQAPVGLTYTLNPATYVAGTAIASNQAVTTGGAPSSFSISPALPAGLAFSYSTGAITGTPTNPSAGALYTVTAGNGGGTTSASLYVAVSRPAAPVIATPPATQVVALDQVVTFSVVATGSGTLTYQWRRDGADVAGATTTSLTTDPVTWLDDDAEFTVTVTDRWGGAVTSAPAKIRLEGFIAGPDMLRARQAHAATRLASGGKVLITGGFAGVILAHAELYDPATGLFADTGDMVNPRQNQTSSLLDDGRVLLTGGHGGVGGGTPLASAELYDPATGTFSVSGPAPMATPRSYHTATVLPDGKVLVAGGLSGGAAASVVDAAEVYDPATRTFLACGSMGQARYRHTATLLPGGKVLVTGGYGLGGAALDSAELYDPALGTFAPTGAMLAARYGQTATLLAADGLVLVAGGFGAGVLDSAELYDPASGNFSSTGSLVVGRSFQTATALPGGKVLLAGGLAATEDLSSAELYDPVLGSFTATGPMEAGRYLDTATLLESGEVLVTGGWSMSDFGQVGTELFSGAP